MDNNHNAKSVSNNNGDCLENPNPDDVQLQDDSSETSHPDRSSSRTPFTNLSQVDADLALARTLQEQERAYMMLRMNNNDGSDYGSWEAGSYVQDDDDDDDDDDFHDDDDDTEEYQGSDVENEEEEEEKEEDAVDVHENGDTEEREMGVYSSDEAYARALQDAEDRDLAARLFALTGLDDHDDGDSESEDNGVNSQDAWEEIDPDELSYEELIALGEVVGTESRGLSADTIASLPSVNYKTGSSQNGSNDSCVICRLDYEDGETLTLLSCKHSYHAECINNWLNINKVCPVCSTEVSTSGNS